MAAHPGSLGVNEQGALVLRVLTADPKVVGPLASAAIEFALRLMREKRADPVVIERSLRAIANLSMYCGTIHMAPAGAADGAAAGAATADVVMATGDAVLAAMRAFPTTTMVQVQGLRALRNLCYQNHGAKLKLNDIGAIPQVRRAPNTKCASSDFMPCSHAVTALLIPSI